MRYNEFAEVYEKLAGTTKRLEKVEILAHFLKKLRKEGKSSWIYLLRGRVVPDFDSRELGISGQLIIKAISKAYGIGENDVVNKYKKLGDFGEIASAFAEKRKQSVLFKSHLEVQKVFDGLQSVMMAEGKGAVDKKLSFIAELLNSASAIEAKYIVRTALSDLRIGMAEGILRDALAFAFFPDKEEMKDLIGKAYDLAKDYAVVFEECSKGEKALRDVDIVVGRPSEVMLAIKVKDIKEGFEAVGKPAAIEQKYDGFRMLIHKKGKEILLFTRRLENVTKQFPDVVSAVEKHIKGESFIFDSEVVGYNPKTKKYLPFEAISQRIKRKYDIEKLVSELPVETNVFDVLYYEGKNVMNEPFEKRRKIVERAVKIGKLAIRPAIQLITDDEKKAQEFYEEALDAGEEGIMLKNLKAEYQQGRRVGYMAKLKPVLQDFDLVIVGAEYGSGKRAGWLTSYIVACRQGDEFLEVGKVSSGLKEKEEEGTSYDEMTNLLKPLITKTEGNVVSVRPKIVVAVTYQNIQKSPSYNSGYAMRFPRITRYRPDKSVKDIATLHEIEKEAGSPSKAL
jgi:DNA ligase-1